jgi:uncharacterized protein DUF2786
MTNDTEDATRKALTARIRALMAKTVANGCTEAEAAAAAAHVDRLLGLYEIDLTEATVQEQEIVRLDIELEEHPVRHAARRIAAFTDCKVWTDGAYLSFLGLEIDTEIAEYLTLLFQRAIDREVGQYAFFDADVALQDGAGRAAMTHSFSVGMATRLGERLVGLKSKRDFTQKATGFDLVLAKKPLVDAAFLTLGITLGRDPRGRSIRHTGAYNAGRSAAEGVAISPGVTGRAGNPGRIK